MRAVPATLLRTWLWRIRDLIWNVVFFDSRCSRLDWNNKIKIKQYLHFAKCFLCLGKALTSCYLCQSEVDLPSSTDSDTVDTVEISGALFAVVYIKELKHGFPGDFCQAQKCCQYKWWLILRYHTAAGETETKFFMLKCRDCFQPSVHTLSNSDWSFRKKRKKLCSGWAREPPELGDENRLRGIGGTFRVPLQNTTKCTQCANNATQLIGICKKNEKILTD